MMTALLLAEVNAYYATFLAIGLPLIAVELYGVARRPGGRAGGDDTISEMWWETRNRYPFLVFAMAAFLVWLFVHFVFEGWKGRGRSET